MTRRLPSPAVLLLAALAVTACAPVAAAGVVVRPTAAMRVYPRAPSTPVTVGRDTVEVLPRGAVAFPVIRRLIDGAHRRVDLEMYELGRPDLLHALVAAHDRGVAVTVIDDPSVDMTAASSAGLRAEGVDVVDYPVRSQMIDHVKLLVVDAQVAVVGGINWGPASAANHDFDAEVEGPAVADLERVFLRDLVTAGRQGVVVPPEVPDRDVMVVATLPFPDIRPLALGCVEGARRTLDLELYVLTDVGIVHAVERARARGVLVRVLLDPTQRPSDPSAAELRASGVDVRLYHGAGELLHAKACTADRRTVVFGSANWSSGGFARNHEVDVALPDAPAVAATFTAAMDADWAAS